MANASRASLVSNLGFVGWIAYGVLAARGHDYLAALAGLALTLLILAFELRMRAVKIIDCTSLAFFVLALGTLRVFGPHIYGQARVVMAWGVFALVAWATLLAGFPFTIQYAREQAPPETWEQPQFHSANVTLTVVWALIFTVSTGLATIALEGRFVLMLELIIPGAGMVFGYAFSRYYPEYLRRRYQTLENAARADG
ncbi:MAG: hypothetical protein ACREQX_11555 [Candidatus Binataceae bacterium]